MISKELWNKNDQFTQKQQSIELEKQICTKAIR